MHALKASLLAFAVLRVKQQFYNFRYYYMFDVEHVV